MMAAPKALSITVLDDGVSDVTGGLKRFYLLEVQEPPTRDTYSLKLADLDEDLKRLFRSIRYENYFTLHTCIGTHLGRKSSLLPEGVYQNCRLDVLNRIISKIRVN